MSEQKLVPVRTHGALSRRHLLHAAAWAAPAIVIATAAPAAAASTSEAAVVVTNLSATRLALASSTLLTFQASLQVIDGTVTTPEIRVLVPWLAGSPLINPSLVTAGWIFANEGVETVNANDFQVFRLRYAASGNFGQDTILGPVEFSVEVTAGVANWTDYARVRARAFDVNFNTWRANTKRVTPVDGAEI